MPNPSRTGFALLELLLVVVILAVVTGYYFNRSGTGSGPAPSTYETTIKRSHNAACAANRMAFRSSLEIFRMNNPGVELTPENLEKAAINIPSCPDGGPFTISPDGNPVCATHDK